MPITTPPASTLSTPSPTETNSPRPTPMPPTRPIYVIVATALSPRMGIGLKGQLPWPSLKSDMAFFRRVTSGTGDGRNAVVMGRKTWESIPVRFRPLGGRVNVVVTRSREIDGAASATDVFVAKSFEEGLSLLKAMEGLGKVFVIGGSQVYGSAIEMALAFSTEEIDLRILQTQVRRKDGREISCDTFFPLDLGGGEGKGWKQAKPDQVKEWVDGDEKIPGGNGGWKVDGNEEMEIRVVGWEKE